MKLAFKSVTIGIIIAYLIPTLLVITEGINATLWIFKTNYTLNILIGIITFYCSAYFYGKKAGKEILIKKRNYKIVGSKYGFLILITTAIISSLTGFLQEGIYNIGISDDPINDYIFKPTFIILVFGLIPSVIIGLLYGGWIYEKSD
ncbi:hypothetical protein [uncultured Christiangramia sp.]|uniref:hypothetical protein n=1 Tax=uncultured Christiangramia sp. TaxID=503836 RepID=UPI0026287C4E|nr:hypothetical protein [uncultured Christiangramia sp.]